MKRLKILRQNSKYTQQELAEILKTTQQTIARWESGKAEPSMSALRDIALLFGTSVDDLLEINPFSNKVMTTSYHMGREATSDGFWGHLGLLLNGQKYTKWFPITKSTADHVSNTLINIDEDNEWFCVTTLNNRMLAISPTKVKRIWLLDDACDQPQDDWKLDSKDDYQGNALEFYRGLSAYFTETLEDSEEFSGDYKKMLEEYAKEQNLDEHNVFEFLHYTTLHMIDGSTTTYYANSKQLYNIVGDIELEIMPKIINIDSKGGDFESYYPSSNISFIEMPLIDIIDEAKEDNDEDDI